MFSLGAGAAVLAVVGCSAGSTTATAPSHVDTSTSSLTPASVVVVPSEATTTPVAVTALVSGTSCPNLQFKISSYLFKLDASTAYTGGTCADVRAGARINFTGSRETENALVFHVAALTFASAPSAPAPPPPPATTAVETEGTVTATGAGRCPELQFFFGTYAFNVSDATQYSGGTCADVAAGARVAIAGTKNAAESFVRVTRLAFRGGSTPAPTPPADSPGRPVDGEGVITTLRTGTTCPALSFYIGSYAITVGAATVFERGACGDLRAGVRVHVSGIMNNNSVAASRISVQDDAPERAVVEGEGRVTRLVPGSACPALAVMIEEYTVSFDASTIFVGGTCADLAAGQRLGVRGLATGDKQVLATHVVFKGTDGVD